VDYTLLECIVALHFKISGRLTKIYPLLVGEASGGVRDALNENEAWRAARDSLPCLVPRACIESAAMLVRMVAEEDLVPCLRNASVYQLMCATASPPLLPDGDGGKEAPFVEGILTHDWCLLTGREQDMALYVQKRFAAHLMSGRRSSAWPMADRLDNAPGSQL
jgi:hypothetical protein